MGTTEIDDTQIRPGSGNQLLGTNSAATKDEYKTLSGTTHQVNVAFATGSITLSTPQNIDTTSTPTFAGENISAALLPTVTATVSLGSSSLDWLDTYAEINQVAQAQAGNQTIAVGFNASVPISHTVPVGFTLFVSLGSFFQIT